MKIKHVSNSQVDYTGEQLRPHWIYENHDLLGDAMVSFVGKADVNIKHMVDLADVKESAFIYSSKMLHFIVEHFGMSVKEAILRQRLIICIIQSKINEFLGDNCISRDGDDLYFEDKKLSVSIATVSPVSALIHIGLNVESREAPVKAAGLLSELNIKDINSFALEIMKFYTNENKQINDAACKVKAVL